jgi:acetyl esterase/lipase
VVRFFLYALSILSLSAMTGFAWYMLSPVYLNMPDVVVYLLLYPYPLILAGIFCLLMSIFSWTRKYRGPARIFSLCFLISCFVTFYPAMAQMEQASQESKIHVSVPTALLLRKEYDQGKSRPVPVIYASLPDSTRLWLDFWKAEKGKEPRPAIIRMHGGGWVYGSRSDMPAWNRWLNKQGYHVFDVEYRLPPPVRWKDEVGDVKCALGWVVANAAEYGVDTSKLVLMGNSAGANLALLAAYSKGDTTLVSSCGALDFPVRAVINIYGPTDMLGMYHMGPGESMFHSALHHYIGGPPDSFPERYRLLSPLSHVRPDVPPTLTIHGETDRIVSVKHAYLLDEQLRKAGVPHRLVTIPVTDHGFDVIWGSVPSQIARAEIKAFLGKYVR